MRQQLMAIAQFDWLHWLLALLVLLTVLLTIRFQRQARRRFRKADCRSRRALNLLSSLSEKSSLEEQLLLYLRAMAQIVDAEYYACYLLEPLQGQYRLQALYQQDDGERQVEIGYSRLTSYTEDHYLPPLLLAAEKQPVAITATNDGQNPKLWIPLAGGVGLVTIGPLGNCTGEKLAELEELRQLVGPLVRLSVAGTGAGRQEEELRTAQSPAADESDQREPAQILLCLIGSLAQAEGGLLLIERDGTAQLLANAPRQSKRTTDNLRQAGAALSRLFTLLDDRTSLSLAQSSPEFSQLPACVAALGDHFLLLGLPVEHLRAIVLLWSTTALNIEQHQRPALPVLLRKMAELTAALGQLSAQAPAYLPILQELVHSTEQLQPQTIGHSQLVARYALAMAKQMHLEEQTCRDVALAALLHDLGMIGLPKEMLCKPGRYTEQEYARLRTHTLTGADMIEATMAEQQVADYVRHHHERWDGQGYPQGLGEENIPLGARIISTADSFVAKLSGRNHRRPLTFEQAIASVKEQSGKELDPRVVEALLGWYQKKSSALTDPFQSLAPCWVMLSCPDELRRTCPAYVHSNLNCWRVAATDCTMRGADCSTCMVYTEYIYRTRHKQ